MNKAKPARKNAAAPTSPFDNLPLPTQAETEAITAARQRLKSRQVRATVTHAPEKPGKAAKLGPTHSDMAGFTARLQDVFGSRGLDFPTVELSRLVLASTLKDGAVDITRLNSLIAVINGVQPGNEVEAMLASQLAVTHTLAMELLNRAQRAEQIPQFEAAGNIAAKLLRAFATHAELLHKMKRGGEQTVRVEHVHVHPGGKAIVGNVAAGGRDGEKTEHQPHASQAENTGQPRSLAFAPGTEMPCLDQERQTLPVSRGAGQSPMPDARRREG